MNPVFYRMALATKFKGGAIGGKFFAVNVKRVMMFKGGKFVTLKGRPLARLWKLRNEGKTLDQILAMGLLDVFGPIKGLIG
jgi:hypothetical protein